MKKLDEITVRALIKRIQAKGDKADSDLAFDELKDVHSRRTDRMVRRIIGRMRNPIYTDLINDSQFALHEAALKFDEMRHKSAVNYLGNYVWEQLKRSARDDRNNAFPGFEIAVPRDTDEDTGEFDYFNVTHDGYFRNFEANPEQVAMLNETFDRLKDIGNTPTNKKETPSVIRVAIDTQEHPEDISVTSIAERTGIAKSTVSDALKKIIKILSDECRTNLN